MMNRQTQSDTDRAGLRTELDTQRAASRTFARRDFSLPAPYRTPTGEGGQLYRTAAPPSSAEDVAGYTYGTRQEVPEIQADAAVGGTGLPDGYEEYSGNIVVNGSIVSGKILFKPDE